MSRFDASAVLANLRAFQRDTAEHATRQLFAPDSSRRFLVADETGLGKSMVARGVIARTIERLQDDPAVQRIDIVYICSNQDIARQNLQRLNVLGASMHESTSRLTLLAKHSRALDRLAVDAGKPVNLISFTPGTSFNRGSHLGTAEERALLFLMLEDRLRLTNLWERKAAQRILQGRLASVAAFDAWVRWLAKELDHRPDPTITKSFLRSVGHTLIPRFRRLIEDIGRRQHLSPAQDSEAQDLVSALRTALARAGVETLEPDLVILDEFQRFRDLLSRETDAGELAHELYEYEGTAKVLLLSATPYKPYSLAEEVEDDHHRDFMLTLDFLSNGSDDVDPEGIATTFEQYRRAATTGRPTTEITRALQDALTKVMSRNERTDHSASQRLTEVTAKSPLEPDDVLGYLALRKLADELEAPMTVEYWKSAPYFINFCDSYRIGERLKSALANPQRRRELAPFLRTTQRIDREAIVHRRPVEYGNARLRALAEATVDAGWWQLLWVPPSLPYLVPRGPFAEPYAHGMTKRLVFSSWSATPTAVAALLSHAAESHLFADVDEPTRRMAQRLRYRVEHEQAQTMSTLALFWPMPGLAELGDPLAAARGARGVVDPTMLYEHVRQVLASELPTGPPQQGTASEVWYWMAALRRPDSLPDDVDDPGLHLGSTNPSETDDEGHAVRAHVHRALETRTGATARSAAQPPPPPDLADMLARIAVHSPANIAWRALGRVVAGHEGVTRAGHWHAAAALAEGLRSLFNRPESMLLLDQLTAGSTSYYWQAVLEYCGWGNLQSVLDEHINHLYSDMGMPALTDELLLDAAKRVAGSASMRPSRYTALDPLDPEQPIAFTSRFALRYGNKRDATDDARMPEVREAFNSPFWPFVLASTSVGQEGIDFHRWSHAVVHWNTPANPVDFEQREGRIDRYAGHATRRNIAARHATGIFTGTDPNPWQTAFRLALDEQSNFGEFAPWWVYPGEAKIRRVVMPYAMSIDVPRLAQLKEEVTLYRLAFGQPRQQDMLELLSQNGAAADVELRREMLLDLRPPPAE
ncbi:hypothetical protein ACQBAU_13010 [Propionibacteriaceae bacterium Y2011]